MTILSFITLMWIDTNRLNNMIFAEILKIYLSLFRILWIIQPDNVTCCIDIVQHNNYNGIRTYVTVVVTIIIFRYFSILIICL